MGKRKAVVLSRFELTPAELVRAGSMFANFTRLVSATEGFVATSVWRGVDNADAFLRVTLYESIDHYVRGWEQMVNSGGLETAVLRYGVLPDVQMFEVVWRHGRPIESARDDEFISVSDRALDTSDQANAWVAKLASNMGECDAIPGFDGCLIAVGYDTPERVAGLALWRSERAFSDSVPKAPDYEIPLFRRLV